MNILPKKALRICLHAFVNARFYLSTVHRNISILYCLEVFIWLAILDRKIKTHHSDPSLSYVQVLNIYKRRYLADQLKCLSRQTLPPRKLVIYQNSSFVPRLVFSRFFDNIYYTHNTNWNTKYHGRFSSVLVLPEKFYIFWDDDHEPGSEWNHYTLEVSAQSSSIVTANGRFIKFSDHDVSGTLHQNGIEFSRITDLPSDCIVDYGGHTWTFSRQTLEDMWSILPVNLENSEDLHISAAAFLQSGTLTIVPAQRSSIPSRLPDRLTAFSFHKSSDIYASHAICAGSFAAERNALAYWWIRKGFVPVSRR